MTTTTTGAYDRLLDVLQSGKEHARHFGGRIDAQRWLDEVTASVITGQYVDPRSGRITSASTPSNGAAGRCIVRAPSSISSANWAVMPIRR